MADRDPRSPYDAIARRIVGIRPTPPAMTGATTAGGTALATRRDRLPLPIGGVGDVLQIGINGDGDTVPMWGGKARLVTASGPVTAADRIIAADASAGIVTLSLPPVAQGAPLTVKKIDATPTNVVLDPAGTDLIDGAASYTLSMSMDAVTIMPGTTAWWIVGKIP